MEAMPGGHHPRKHKPRPLPLSIPPFWSLHCQMLMLLRCATAHSFIVRFALCAAEALTAGFAARPGMPANACTPRFAAPLFML
eukprot:scaffold12554_cov21-Tisochrysis_lutea.AAC.2